MRQAESDVAQPILTVCALCRIEAKLRNSHVFPEFLYKSVYDEQHRAVGISPVRGANWRTVQKGLRERLLCGTCEGELAKLERYADSVLRRLPDTQGLAPGTLAQAEGVRYLDFKLFQLSLLWRASVARQPSFEQVDLGPHEERMRQMLLARAPGGPLEYPCLLIRTRGGESLAGLVKFPGRSRLQGQRIYHMIAGGLVWIYFVASTTEGMRERRSFLSLDSLLPINIASGTASNLLRGVGQGLRALGVMV